MYASYILDWSLTIDHMQTKVNSLGDWSHLEEEGNFEWPDPLHLGGWLELMCYDKALNRHGSHFKRWLIRVKEEFL